MPDKPHAYFCFATRLSESDLAKLVDWLATCVGEPFSGDIDDDDFLDAINNGVVLPTFPGIELLAVSSSYEPPLYLLTAGHQEF
jgi:hypothetical protein